MGIVRIAMYLRLSNEDRDKGSKEESNSISAQRALIEAAKGGMSVALKNLVYGMYSADLSKKVRSARDTRVRSGEFVGQVCPLWVSEGPGG